MDESTTRSPLSPRTLHLESTTAMSSSSRPMRHEQEG